MNSSYLAAVRLVIVFTLIGSGGVSGAYAQPNAGPIIIKKKISAPPDSTPEKVIPQVSRVAVNEPQPYNPRGKIDPFQPFISKKTGSRSGILTPVIDRQGDRTPLENFALSQLKLTGVIHATSGSKGLVQESAGRGHIVSVGTFIGNRGGQVVSILGDKLIIEEKLKDDTGKIIVKNREMKLLKKEGLSTQKK